MSEAKKRKTSIFMDCKDEYLFHSNDLPSKSFAFFEEKRNEFCDIMLRVGQQSISGHRIILSAAIPYVYKALSDKGVLHSPEGKITFPDADPDALESLIEYAYTRRVKITTRNVLKVLKAACLLQMDEVRVACCRFLSSRLNVENVWNIREHASELNCTHLLEKVDVYIAEHFEKIACTSDFLDIPFDFLAQLTARDDLKTKCEERVFEIVMKWIKQSPRDRQGKLPALLRNVRFPLVKPAYIKNCIQKEKLIKASMECRDLLDEATFYHLLPEERAEVCSFSTRPRSFIPSNENTGVRDAAYIYTMGSQVKHEVQRFDLGKGKWETTVNLDFMLNYTDAVAELNKKMYCFLPKLTYVYDLETGNFSFSKGMSVPRNCAGSTSHGKKLYVLGGFKIESEVVIYIRELPSINTRSDVVEYYAPSTQESDTRSDVVECYDPLTEKWTVLTNMNMRRESPGVVASANFIYVLGGRLNDSIVLDTAEKFSVSTGMWINMPRMRSKRCSVGCAILKDKIYVCGGETECRPTLSSAEVFDTVTDQWKRIASLNSPRRKFKLVSGLGKLYAIGGSKGRENLYTVEIYEPEKKKWRHGNDMERKMKVVGAAFVPLHSD